MCTQLCSLLRRLMTACVPSLSVPGRVVSVQASVKKRLGSKVPVHLQGGIAPHAYTDMDPLAYVARVMPCPFCCYGLVTFWIPGSV
jgi:hypothetical protein